MGSPNPLADSAPTDPEDHLLVTRARSGEREALETLVGRHQTWIYNIALRMLSHPQDAQDATQEILITDGVTHLEDLSEDVNEALLTSQTEKHPRGAADLRLIHQESYVDRQAVLVRRVQVGRGVESMSVASKGQSLRCPPAPPDVEDVIDHDPVEPSPEAAAPLERRQSCECLDEDLLGRVLGVLWMGEHAERDVVDPRLVTSHQCLQRLTLARPGARHEQMVLRVGGSTVGEGIRAAHRFAS